MQVIKWFQNANWEQRVILDNVPFFLEATWNIRDDSWNVSVYTNENDPVVLGVRLNLNIDVLDQVQGENRPGGYLMVVPISSDVTEITRDNMGSDVELIFVSYNEIL